MKIFFRVPNRSARQAPLGFASEVIHDLVADRLAIADLVCLIEKDAGPLGIQQFATIATLVRQKCVVRRHHNTIGTNILRTARRGIRREIFFRNVLDIRVEFLAPLLEKVVRNHNQIRSNIFLGLSRNVVQDIDCLSETHVVSQDSTARRTLGLLAHPLDSFELVRVKVDFVGKAHFLREVMCR